jgi:hypothetical protein
LSTGLASLEEPAGHAGLDLNLDEPDVELASEQESHLLDFDLPDAPSDSHASRTRH